MCHDVDMQLANVQFASEPLACCGNAALSKLWAKFFATERQTGRHNARPFPYEPVQSKTTSNVRYMRLPIHCPFCRLSPPLASASCAVICILTSLGGVWLFSYGDSQYKARVMRRHPT